VLQHTTFPHHTSSLPKISPSSPGSIGGWSLEFEFSRNSHISDFQFLPSHLPPAPPLCVHTFHRICAKLGIESRAGWGGGKMASVVFKNWRPSGWAHWAGPWAGPIATHFLSSVTFRPIDTAARYSRPSFRLFSVLDDVQADNHQAVCQAIESESIISDAKQLCSLRAL